MLAARQWVEKRKREVKTGVDRLPLHAEYLGADLRQLQRWEIQRRC